MSGSVFLNNLDDYILPSQACVNPLVASRIEESKKSNAITAKRVVLSIDFSSSEAQNSSEIKPNLIKSKAVSNQNGEHKVATVSLNDCLACSGCVTSAEAILIQEQSYEKLLEKLREGKALIVVMLSPNSVASLAHFMNEQPYILFLKLASFLKAMGVQYVVDASSTGDIALLESREEFLSRYLLNGTEREIEWKKPMTSTAISSTSIQTYGETKGGAQEVLSLPQPELSHKLPMLTSNCPGWVCYAEKTQPQALPYISTVKSPQQILGTLMKLLLSPLDTASTSDEIQSNREVFVVSIQPCFDKKLEASRLDFYHEETDREGLRGNEVDLVLSTTELWNLIKAQCTSLPFSSQSLKRSAIDLDNAEETITNEDSSTYTAVLKCFQSLPLDTPDPLNPMALESLFRCYSSSGKAFVQANHSSHGSGGYAEYIFKYIAEKFYHITLGDAPLEYTESPKNPDFAYIDLAETLSKQTSESSDTMNSQYKLRFAKAYGFRNIQSIIRRLKKEDCEFDFVEIMACPSGCNNGGGQVKALMGGAQGEHKELPSYAKERVRQVETLYHQSIEETRSPDESPLVKYLYQSTVCSNNETEKDAALSSNSLFSSPLCEKSLKLFHTRYHAVPKLEFISPLATKW